MIRVERRTRRALGALGGSVALGVGVGLAWALLAPRPQFEVVEGGITYTSDLPGEYIAMDGWFVALTAVAALVSVTVLLVRSRRRPVGIGSILLLTAGSLLGAVVAWQVGLLVSPERDLLATTEPVGSVLHGSLELHAKGVLLAWPVVALGVLLFALAWQGPRESAGSSGGPSGAVGSTDR